MTYYQYPDGEVHDLSFTPGEHSEGVAMTEKAGKAARAVYCRRELKKLLKPGATVLCILRHVSASGMSRRIDLYTIKRNELIYLSAYAADLAGDKLSDKGGIVVGGCGMDMGCHLVHCLGARIWPKGTRKPHGKRNGEPDHEGGYALRQEWI